MSNKNHYRGERDLDPGAAYKVGDAIQIRPDADSAFRGCFAVIREVNKHNVVAYCVLPTECDEAKNVTIADLKLPYDVIEYVGSNVFPLDPSKEKVLSVHD